MYLEIFYKMDKNQRPFYKMAKIHKIHTILEIGKNFFYKMNDFFIKKPILEIGHNISTILQNSSLNCCLESLGLCSKCTSNFRLTSSECAILCKY